MPTPEHPFKITLNPSADEAEADDIGAALSAARTMWDDHTGALDHTQNTDHPVSITIEFNPQVKLPGE